MTIENASARQAVAKDDGPSTDEALDRAIRDMREALAEDHGAAHREPATGNIGAPDREFLLAIPVTVEAVIGTLTMPMAELMALKQGARINLERRLGEPIDITANGSRIARGELTVLETDPPSFGVVLTEVAGV
jgi:flagellar motor switch protein FliN/FliY